MGKAFNSRSRITRLVPAQLKRFFDRRRVELIADQLAIAWEPFPRGAFVEESTRGLDKLELLDRGRHIAAAMARALPSDYRKALDIVVRSLGPPLESTEGNGMDPFHYLPHVVFVADRGLDHPDESLSAQRELTRRFSCEFSIRPFIERHPARTMDELWRWTRDPDEHVRRLVSEGTRPRLPWASRLPAFQEDPAPVLELLGALRDDPSEYVRRSVANNLNDISKDHPDLVADTCEAWMKDASPERRRLVHHALRTLARKGHPRAIRLLGGSDGAKVTARGEIAPPRPRIGQSVRFSVEVRNDGHAPVTLVLALRVHFVKARGGVAPRSFKLRTTKLEPGVSATISKTVSLRQHTTRTHHPGSHRVELVVNGTARSFGDFVLVQP